MNHLMVDIETMGNGSNAAIMSIGACYFDPKTGEIGKTFHREINLASSAAYGCELDASTVIWWMDQDDAARAKFKRNGKADGLLMVIADFMEFAKGFNTQVWGNGATFDNVIIKNAAAECSVDVSWKFWNDRDVRTIVELGKVIGIDPKRDIPFEGVAHDALDDAKHQAKYVSIIWQALTGV